jgi:hypothetical protein
VKRDEFLAGAPILRGRWSTITLLWWAGYCVGRARPVYTLLGVEQLSTFNWLSYAVGFVSLIAGILFLDQYARNCWLQAGRKWRHLKTSEVKRKPWVPWRSSSAQ